MEARRIVTGHDDGGRAVFVSDERAARSRWPWSQGWTSTSLGCRRHLGVPRRRHQARRPPVLPAGRQQPVRLLTIPPDGGARLPQDLDIEAALAELEQNLPGLAEYVESENPGMQTTAIID